MIDVNRLDKFELIDKKIVEEHLNSGKELIIQFVSDKKYNDKILEDINDLCKRYTQNLSIRFYGHRPSVFDCVQLAKIPEVRNLCIDCLDSAKNLNHLSKLHKLNSLSLGIYNLEEAEILGLENLMNLKELIITDTKTKALNLDYLRHFKNLKSLTIYGHTKNIEAIGQLIELESLSLNSVKKAPLHFINKLKNLKTLNFLLGSRENLNEIENNGIENLNIVWVRGFNDLSCISKFLKLKTLKIGDEIQLQKVQFDNVFPDLTDLKILNCKTLDTIIGLNNLPQLNSLVVYQTKIDFDNLIKQELPKELKHFGFYTTKSKIDKDIKATIESKGYSCN